MKVEWHSEWKKEQRDVPGHLILSLMVFSQPYYYSTQCFFTSLPVYFLNQLWSWQIWHNEVSINANKTCFCEFKISQLKLFWLAMFCVVSPDIAASEPIANMLLNAEESWLQRLADPSAPLPPTDQCYDGGSHDINTPVKNLWVLSQTYCNCLVTLQIINYVSFTHFLASSTFFKLFFLSLHRQCLLYLISFPPVP